MSNESKESQSLVTQGAVQNVEDMEYLKSFGRGALDSLGQGDLIMPRYRLVQNTSREGTPGKWLNNLDSSIELDRLNIIILQISNFRTYFPPKGQGNDKPLCRSNDGIKKVDETGVGDSFCKTCRYSVWRKDERGATVKPPCSMGYTILGLIELSPGMFEPGMVSFKGAAIRSCKRYFTRMTSRGIAPFLYLTSISSESVTNDKGRYFVPVFEMGRDLTREEINFAAEQFKSCRQYMNTDLMVDTFNDEEASSPSSGAADFLNSLEKAASVASVAIEEDDLPF